MRMFYEDAGAALFAFINNWLLWIAIALLEYKAMQK